jgi:xanthine/uracil/vitamin C permease (AzgA family)
MPKDLFDLQRAGTTRGREVVAGVTTFLTMSYIIFVQPAVLSACGMDFGAVMVATCVSSAIATLVMGFLANYPIALAPAMGHNFYFAFTVCGTVAMGGLGYSWETALAAVFVSGALFLILSFWGMRELIMSVVPGSLKSAIAVGIGHPGPDIDRRARRHGDLPRFGNPGGDRYRDGMLPPRRALRRCREIRGILQYAAVVDADPVRA